MTTNLTKRITLSQDSITKLQTAFTFSNEETLEMEAEFIHLNFIQEVQKRMEQQQMSKKDLADALGTSKSYITQLFSGDKLLNLKLLAKLQRVLGVRFGINVTTLH